MKDISLDAIRLGPTSTEPKTRFEQTNEDRLNMNFRKLKDATANLDNEKASSEAVDELRDELHKHAHDDRYYTEGEVNALLLQKADWSGGTFTGDVDFAGIVDVLQRRCHAELSSPGWYRVMSFRAGTAAMAGGSTGLVIRFNIVRRGSTVGAESHSITFRSINSNNGGFECENSKSDSLLIDKIRQTVDGTIVYFDVHYVGSAANQTTCYFDCYVRPEHQERILSESLTPVLDAPTGETIVMTHDFSGNIHPSYVNYYDEESAADYTIGSSNYIAIQYPQSVRGKKIISITLIRWTSNSGAFTMLPYGDSAGTNWYIVGNSGTTINGARFRYWYI